jgi:ubiquinone/menaquinone biosynthesis C-methylase UbiE
MNSQFEAAAQAARDWTDSYLMGSDHQAHWYGVGEEAMNYRAQQLRSFGRLLRTVTPSLQGWRVMDVGCGDGTWTRSYVEFGAEPEDITGVDVSDAWLDQARRKNPAITYVTGDGINLPFPDASFDLVTQWVCFSCIPDYGLRRRVAGEIMRVMKPNGYIFWWDLPATVHPSRPGEPLNPSEYFELPIREMRVGPLPRVSEALRPLRGAREWIGPALDVLGHHPSHIAALLGPAGAEDNSYG